MEIQQLLLTQFDLHHRLYNNVLEGFTDKETNQRLDGYPQMNHVKYLAGHILNSHYGLATITGIQKEAKWNELFAVMDQSEAKDNYPYPSIEEIKVEWNELFTPLRYNLKKMSSDDLNARPPAPFDQVANSSGELWTFINHHVAYHIGQIGILRRGFGKSPMSYE